MTHPHRGRPTPVPTTATAPPGPPAPSRGPTAPLVVAGLGLRTGRRELWRGLDLTAEPGAAVAVTGPNGSGKSSLLACIAGLRAPTTGTVTVAGSAVGTAGSRALRRHLRETCGVLLQHGSLVPEWTVRENVDVVRPHGVSRETRRARGRAALRRLQLDGRGDDVTGHLSGGEQQRVAAARLLVHRPALVVADEPTSALDPAGRELVLDALDELRREGTVVVVATHDPVVAEWCDVVVELGGADQVARAGSGVSSGA